MKYCQKCGSKITEGSLFCTVCGFKVEQPTTKPLKNKTPTSPTQKMSSVFANNSVLGVVGKVFVGASIVAATGVTILLGIDNYSNKNKTEKILKEDLENTETKSTSEIEEKIDYEYIEEETQEVINYDYNEENFLTFAQKQDYSIKIPPINKGTIPTTSFSVTDPCQSDDDSGLPWENSTKVKLPKGVSVPLPKPIPDLKELSKISYNAAVSIAFEGMRLVYGPMPKEEYQKFENVWLPLFDNPDQTVIDYLNKLNPLLSQFLSAREAYMRNISDVQRVLFDVVTAIRFEDQEAWESAMAEGEMYAAATVPLESAMRNLATQIEQLGNPPNPNELKCEKKRRYNKFFEKEPPNYSGLVGEWIGYTESDLYDKWEKRRPLHIVIYSMPMEDPYAKKTYEMTEAFSLNPDGFTIDHEWAGYKNIRYWDAPVAAYKIPDIMKEDVDNTEFDFSYERTFKTANGEKIGVERVFLQKVTGDILPSFKYLGPDRIKELATISKDLANNADPNDYILGNEITAVNFYLERVKSYNSRKGIFHNMCQLWLENLPLEMKKYDATNERIEVFTKQMQHYISNTPEEQLEKIIANKTPEKEKNNESNDESIAFHQEIIQVIQKQIEREREDLSRVRESFANAKSKQERENINKQIKDFNLRIINYQSNLQSERDLVTSYQTGKLVHTRQIFDDYARAHFIAGIKKEVVNIDATRRIASRIQRQIKLLPWQERARARKTARNVLNSKTLVSGDIKKARKLTSAFNKKIQGYANYDLEMANEEIIASEENEFIAKSVIMASGAVFVGVGTAGLIEAYGAEATISIYGPQLLGGIWGGTTGTISGGPKEGVREALSFSSPLGQASVSFFDGYQHAGYQEDATISSKIWNGTYEAGKGYLIGKVFELSAAGITKATLSRIGKNSRLLKPIVKPSKLRAKQILSSKIAKVREQRAKDNMQLFEKLESRFAKATGADKTALNKELQQLAAELNLSHEAKWLLKYKANPKLRNSFDTRVQTNYNEMTPKMISELKAKGYNMDNIEFIQFRNANSAGSSSMDLDYVPVIKGTKQEPGINGKIIKKDGSIVSIETFMKDTQQSMQKVYYAKHKINAKLSDMQVITSAHGEAYANIKMLDPDFDFSKISAKDYKSIGEVLQVKMDGINNNKMLTKTMQLRAKCRESAKEIENMFLKKLRADLSKATTKPAKLKAQNDINYWESMLKKFKRVGMNETDPLKIIKLNREIMRETGGRDLHGVINDLRNTFNKL